MAREDESPKATEQAAPDIQRIKQRLDLLDQRLDNMDSMLSVIAERVMRQMVTLDITCPHCGKDIEIAIAGTQKPKR